MQDCLALYQEITQLTRKFHDLTVVKSSESWNPVAALIIGDFEMPVTILPRKSTLRIPIPDLYGFTTSAYCFIFPTSLVCAGEGQSYSMPGSHLLDETCVSRHKEQFVDFRERRSWPETPITFFLNPLWDDQGFVHDDLNNLIARLLKFLAAPETVLQQDMEYCIKQWEKTRFWWWLCRVGEISLDLGNMDTAQETLSIGAKLFPKQSRFQELLGRFS